MKAIVKTKSNYNNCNGKELEVVAFLGKIVACKVPQFGFDKLGTPQGHFTTADFNIKEIVSITQ